MSKPKLLITGMSGLIGNVLRKTLSDNYELTALNRRAVPVVRTFQSDISNLDSIQEAFIAQDVVIHLAAMSTTEAGWDDIQKHNVSGTYNVFEASRRAKVKRVIFASSGAVTSGWEHVEPYNAIVQGRYNEVPKHWPMISHESTPRPMGLYGCSKIWGEGLARHFVDSSDISILSIRIGVVNEQNRPVTLRDYSAWCSYRDLTQLVILCLNAPAELRHDVFYAVSGNRWNYRDLSHAEQVLGFIPKDSADAYR